ncbi:MAG: alpha/beta fold hydrolase [Fimbriimonadaceae bacterium]|nr:alpha/beta fold hydrolase [Fimbriimonadaceae bacterium]
MNRRFLFVAALWAVSVMAWAQPLPRKAAFGAQLLAATPEQRSKAGLKEGEGVTLGNVLPALSAEAAGLKTGDILIAVDGKKVGTPADCVAVFRTKNGGESVTVEYVREGKRDKKTIALKERPRQKPDGFEVVYDQVVSNGKRIRLIVTRPSGGGKHPVVMLIGGIGAYSVDGDFPNVAYGKIMGPIAKAGYATARIDKPGQGDSEGPIYSDLTFNVELEAYRDTLKALKKMEGIDPDKIFIFGHSMGGAFGPILGAETDLAGIMVGGTIAKTWTEYMLENTRRQSLLSGASLGDVGASQMRLASIVHYLFTEGKTPDQIAKDHPDLAGDVRGMVPDGKTYSGVGLPFFKELAGYNLAGYWTKVKAPTLAFWGENDFISTEEDHEMIKKIVGDKGTFVKVPQSDHGFFKTTSFADSAAKWGRPGSEFNPNIIDILLGWLKERR